MASDPVDWSHFRDITLGDEDIAADIISLFKTNIGLYTDVLEAALGSTDRAWYDAAHKIKGVARSIGAFNLAKLAELAEPLIETTDRRSLLC